MLLAANPVFAEQTPPPQTGVNEQNGDNNDFNNDVQNGKDELKKDPEAERLQKEVVDGEDGMAGEGDGQNNQEGIDEYGDIQQAEDNQGVHEDDKDINNSDIDEVNDANNLDEASQEIINEHRTQEEREIENEIPNQEGGSSQEQNLLEEPSGNQ